MSIQSITGLSDARIEELGEELNAIYEETKADLGRADEKYIRRMITVQRSMALLSRLTIFASLLFAPWGLFGMRGLYPNMSAFFSVIGVGTFFLAMAKILENMEIAHNVMHGQWDWMRDPAIHSGSWEWDNVCPSDQWKHSHNVVHHTWTNVMGRDRDIGYEIMRVDARQEWHWRFLPQPIYNFLLGLLFEWGVALHDLELDEARNGRKTMADHWPLLKRIGAKAFRQLMKDVVLWPLLAGPFYLLVLGANVVANLIRNVWSYMIIFCGHFPEGVHVFEESDLVGETRARWYLRQMLSSCNITGGKLFHIMSGNLSHQIEHHLFPDMPSNRYPQVAPRIEALCARYGIPYNKGSLTRQFGTTTLKIWRLSLPTPRPALG